MMFRLFFFSSVFFFVGCIQHQETENEGSEYYPVVEVDIEYALGFEVETNLDYTVIRTHSISGNEDFADSLMLPHRQFNFPKGSKVIYPNFSSVSCQSSTHLAFLSAIDEMRKVKGVCGLEFITSRDIKKVLEENKAEEICLGEQPNIEQLLKLESELFFIYPFGKSQQERFEESGISTLLIAEYLETSQLARLEWIKVFGLIFNKATEAEEYFNMAAKEYHELKSTVPETKTFIMNVPYGESWFMPSSKSVGVQVIQDAGLTYYYADQSGTENMTRAKEEVWSDGIEADYWIIIADRPQGFNLSQLLQEEDVYREFKAVKNNQVLFCNTRSNDYFVQAVAEPHIVLRDLLFLTGQLQDHEPQYFKRLE